MSEQTTQSLVRTIPAFRADQVGSLLRPDRIKKARLSYANGNITADNLREIENEEITRIVQKQKETGLKVVTDGEFRRAWWHLDFLSHLGGVEQYDANNGIQFSGTQTKAKALRIVDKITFNPSHPFIEDYKFLHSVAGEHTAKMTIPSPSMLHFRSNLDLTPYKGNQEAYFHDLAEAYKQTIQAFYDAGCRYLQLDDTSWAYFCSEEQREQMRARGLDPEETKKLYAKTINEAISDRPDDMTITMHICRGNFRSTWISSGGYEPVAQTLFGEVNVDGYFLEYDNERSGGFEPLRYVKRKDLQIILGLITSKHGELEEKDDIKQRIEEAAKYIPLDQLCLSPQCGFASTEEGNILTEEAQWKKLHHVVTIADEVWK